MVRWLADVVDDVTYALRGMRRRPGFAAAMVPTLALGIAATTAVFSVVSAVLLKPLPYPDADRLVLFANSWRGRPLPGMSLPRIAAWREHTDAVEEVGLYRIGESINFSLTSTTAGDVAGAGADKDNNSNSDDSSAQLLAGRATIGFFRLLGASAMYRTRVHRRRRPPARTTRRRLESRILAPSIRRRTGRRRPYHLARRRRPPRRRRALASVRCAIGGSVRAAGGRPLDASSGRSQQSE